MHLHSLTTHSVTIPKEMNPQSDVTVGAQVPALTSFPYSICELHSTAKLQKVILNRKTARFPPAPSSLLGPSTFACSHVPPCWSLWPQEGDVAGVSHPQPCHCHTSVPSLCFSQRAHSPANIDFHGKADLLGVICMHWKRTEEDLFSSFRCSVIHAGRQAEWVKLLVQPDSALRV